MFAPKPYRRYRPIYDDTSEDRLPGDCRRPTLLNVMSARRHETDRETAASVERIWQRYADEIGIPTAGSPADNPSLPRQTEQAPPQGPSARVVGQGVGRILSAVAVIVVTVTAGIALWRGFSTSPDRAEPRSPTVASAPATEVSRITPAATTVAIQSVEMPSRITFDFGSDLITDESKASLERVVIAMISNPDWRVTLEGHTDLDGLPDLNRSLSERRAHAARAYIASAGIAPERLSAIGFGALRPVAPNNPVGNILNRRVDILRQ
jgi:outer membrane protein OmpA-like peptidoglycan-associated protein